MDRRAFLALLATAPIAACVALAPLPAVIAEWQSMQLFVTLPTDHPIVQMAEIDGYLCALTADETCWVLDASGRIVGTFHR